MYFAGNIFYAFGTDVYDQHPFSLIYLQAGTDISPAAPQAGMEPPTYKACVVSTRRQVPTNWVSGRTLQPSIESVVVNSFVPSDFLVDGQVSQLGTVHPLLTLSFFSM